MLSQRVFPELDMMIILGLFHTSTGTDNTISFVSYHSKITLTPTGRPSLSRIRRGSENIRRRFSSICRAISLDDITAPSASLWKKTVHILNLSKPKKHLCTQSGLEISSVRYCFVLYVCLFFILLFGLLFLHLSCNLNF